MSDEIKKPDFNDLSPEQKGQVCFQKATKLHKENKLDEALNFYGQAVAFFPNLPDAYNNMAVALRKLKHFEAALSCYQRSLAVRPDHAGTYSNMGNVLNDLDRMDEAIAAHGKAVELDPDNLLFIYNMGLVLRDAGKPKNAITCFNKVLKQEENFRDCRWDRSLTYLMAGNFKKGFAEYDSRWQLEKSPPRPFPQPRWEGDSLQGKTLFIHREQGFGDALQFVRLIPAIKKRFGGTILLESQPELINLFHGMEGIDQHIPYGMNPPSFDVWIPLMSLGHILQVDEDNIPGTVPYLDAPKQSRFRVRPAPEGGLNIAIAWAGSPTHQNDRRRSVDLEQFLALFGHKDVTVFSLQKGKRSQDIKTIGATPLIIDAGSQIKDFSESAALIDQLDLIITVDTSLAHLAGGLGKETWVLLPYTPDWRWMLKREDSPWYPNMRLFRQDKPGDWDSAFKKLYQALAEKLAD